MFKSENSLARLLYLGVPFGSLFLLTGVVTDPVNAPKFFALGGVALGTFGFLLRGGFLQLIRNYKIPSALAFLFIGWASLSTIVSDLPFTQNLYGVYGRNTGYLTYLFLALVFLGSMLISKLWNFTFLIYGLLVAGLVNALYCGWVIAFGDFIGWNNPYKNVLGLFGNPNFVGSFLGIFLSVFFAFFFQEFRKRSAIIPSLLVVFITGIAIKESHAIQGIVVSLAGIAVVGFFALRTKCTNNLIIWLYSVVLVGVGVVALAGALQKGPLSSLIYKTSVSLRGAYWNSGIATGMENPLFGVGMDGYGDWYRRSRSEHAASVLPGPNTVTNAAHNVIIDIFSYGGFPLALIYVLLMLYTAISAFSFMKSKRQYDPTFVALLTAWIGYNLQSLISINQIGLAIWGWVLTGALIAYVTKRPRELNENHSAPKQQPRANYIFSPTLIAGLTGVIGLFIASPPLASDIKWKAAIDSRNLEQVQLALKPSYLNPSDSNKYMKAVELLAASDFKDLAIEYAREGREFNPDSFDAWRAVYILTTNEEEKAKALENMKRLDPKNPEITR